VKQRGFVKREFLEIRVRNGEMVTSVNDVICPVCSELQEPTRYRRSYFSSYENKRYSLYHCERCDLEFWSPLRMIPAFYEQEGVTSYESFHAGTRPFPHWTLPFFEKMELRAGKLLDVGCGDGAFLERVAHRGFAVHGIDLDRRSVAVARELRGLSNVESKTLAEHAEQCRQFGTHYDVITFFEVLEHQDDPMNFLHRIATLLVPGGRIAGSVPNRERFLGWFEKQFDAGDLPPHHFLWFSTPVLQNILVRAMFEDVVIVPAGQLDFSEVRKRLMRIFKRVVDRFARPLVPTTTAIAWLTSWPLAFVLWVGMRYRPRHLYFQARWPN
jgi:2-polyprenyl-3-methyl-5-hydroxy-6-metoxy-1,4-benzoquinol methylase